MTCLQKKEKLKENNKHPTILKLPDELWDNLKIFTKGETTEDSWSANCTIPKSD
ncbi:MAG TPA: hypothetical protein VIY08_00185 [Candidatus Nitrosocosmicus sp.]